MPWKMGIGLSNRDITYLNTRRGAGSRDPFEPDLARHLLQHILIASLSHAACGESAKLHLEMRGGSRAAEGNGGHTRDQGLQACAEATGEARVAVFPPDRMRSRSALRTGPRLRGGERRQRGELHGAVPSKRTIPPAVIEAIRGPLDLPQNEHRDLVRAVLRRGPASEVAATRPALGAGSAARSGSVLDASVESGRVPSPGGRCRRWRRRRSKSAAEARSDRNAGCGVFRK
ncbi:hypothetical protein B0H13DRAFT_1874213 [Mycena leptocephala]|nr:hypothetical protein B0H13DRAFT_1874213 [Mycena leptocephala]